MILSLTRSVTFHARHRLSDRRLTAAENRSRFGDTASDHGHAYTLSVTLSGEPDPVTGVLLDLGRLDQLLSERVVQPLDGKNLNEVVPPFASGDK
ncbi:MAG: 6-carboxytetrahydropterin synthase, partial [Gemmatimonadales bacterium]